MRQRKRESASSATLRASCGATATRGIPVVFGRPLRHRAWRLLPSSGCAAARVPGPLRAAP
eukprot:6093628-Alexandrium_andersonii.AAC.1